MAGSPMFLAAAMILVAGPAGAQSNDLKASLAQIPGVADSPEKGTFVELVKALGQVYTDGKITIEVYPFGRSIQNVTSGAADFHIPSFISPGMSDAGFPYSWVPEKMGSFTMMLYSHRDHPITRKDLNDALARDARFPYVIEVGGGTQLMFPFPVVASNDEVASLRKLQARRIDAMIYGGEVDNLIKEMKLKMVHRAPYAQFDDVILVPKTPRGEIVKKMLDEAMKKLAASGKLQAIYARVHVPYKEWQPADQDW
jgi:polar amino acid transport system substrate-binding protein